MNKRLMAVGCLMISSALTGDVWIKRDATGLMIFVR